MEALDQLADQIEQLRATARPSRTSSDEMARSRLLEKGQLSRLDVEIAPTAATQGHLRWGLNAMVSGLMQQRKAGAKDCPYTMSELRTISSLLNGNATGNHLRAEVKTHGWAYEQCRRALAPQATISEHGIG